MNRPKLEAGTFTTHVVTSQRPVITSIVSHENFDGCKDSSTSN